MLLNERTNTWELDASIKGRVFLEIDVGEMVFKYGDVF